MAVNRDDGTDVPNPGRRPPRRWTKWLGCFVLISLLAAGVYLATLRHHWRAEFHQRVEAIRAAGFPVTGKELDAWYLWPQAGDNAAKWITGAAALQQKPDQDQWQPLESLLGRSGERPHPAEPLGADLKKSLEQYIGDNSRALESLHEAAAIAECRYPVDFSAASGSVLMPHISEVRNSCLLLGLEAILQAENKDPHGTIKAVEAVLHVAQSLDREPVLLSNLMRMIGANVAAIALERALSQIEFTEEQLAGLQRAFNNVHRTDGLLRGLAGNRCMHLTAFEKPQALDRSLFGHLPPVPFLEVYDALGLSARDGIIFLDYVDECIRIVQLPAPKRFAALAVVEARLRDGKGVLFRDFGYMPMFIRREAREAALFESATTALAVERYRLARAGVPETLGRLVPDYLAAVPEDPFDGAPLRYKRVDRGFTVYSVGEDGKDDGGKEEPRKKEGQTYDLVFRMERPLVVTP